MADSVSVYRKRLNRWKNIGVWLVFCSVGAAILSVGMVKYYIVIESVEKDDYQLQKWIRLGLAFGGINIVCQVTACLIMLAATLKMKKLTNKNGFDTSQFQDIKMNLVVSLLICIGYAIDYIADIIITVLYIENKIDLD